MLFNSFTFSVFFITVTIFYYALRHDYKKQNILLLFASFYFYASWNFYFLSLLALSIFIDFYFGLKIDASRSENHKKKILILSLISNLGILGFFKYFNFFVSNVADLLNVLGFHANLRTLSIILPVGISFYTFQSMSYTIDIYRGKLKAVKSFWDYALYVSFFPQLVAGPIVRAVDFIPQINKPRRVNKHDVEIGLWLMLWGLFKKVVIADNCAGMVDQVYAPGALIGGGDVVVGTLLFAFQIYGDFSGYSDMAIGTARILGFHFDTNFNLPYFATSPGDFWKRWHISLSSWLRDYLYIPLGGNQQGKFRTYRNLILTMLLGGLWHGAAWNFVLWGAFHGALLIIFKVIRIPFGIWEGIRMAGMFFLTNVAWLLFRASSLEQIQQMISLVFNNRNVNLTYDTLWEVLFYIFILLGFGLIQYYKKELHFLIYSSKIKKYPVYAFISIFVFLSGQFAERPFIYFQF